MELGKNKHWGVKRNKILKTLVNRFMYTTHKDAKCCSCLCIHFTVILHHFCEKILSILAHFRNCKVVLIFVARRTSACLLVSQHYFVLILVISSDRKINFTQRLFGCCHLGMWHKGVATWQLGSACDKADQKVRDFKACAGFRTQLRTSDSYIIFAQHLPGCGCLCVFLSAMKSRIGLYRLNFFFFCICTSR